MLEHNKLWTIDPAKKGVAGYLDMKVLYYILSISQNSEEKFSSYVEFSLYEIVVLLGMPKSGESYRRVRESLSLWCDKSFEYDAIWWKDGKKQSFRFDVLDQWRIHAAAKKVQVRLNDIFLETIEESNYYKMIDTRFLFLIKKPLTARLYEFLTRQFLTSDSKTFRCTLESLGSKLGISDTKPSNVSRKISPAIAEWNALYSDKDLMKKHKVDLKKCNNTAFRLIYRFSKSGGRKRGDDIVTFTREFS